MRLFLDANIIVAILNKQYPIYIYAARILSLVDSDKGISIYTSPLCLSIAYYFAQKKCGNKKALRKINTLVNKIKITNCGEGEVMQAMSNKKILDFEDGIEYYAALSKKCHYIITEDIKDYYFSEIPVMDAKQFFEDVL